MFESGKLVEKPSDFFYVELVPKGPSESDGIESPGKPTDKSFEHGKNDASQIGMSQESVQCGITIAAPLNLSN